YRKRLIVRNQQNTNFEDLSNIRALAKLVVLLLVVPTFLVSVPAVRATMLTPHSPIVISGDVDFTAANGVTGGTGTASDPYITECWHVTSRTIFGPAGIT